MVTAPADVVLPQSPGSPASVLRSVGIVGLRRDVGQTRASVLVVPKSSVSVLRSQQQLHQPQQRCRRRFQAHKERWPWSFSPREDARVPAPHEVPKAATASPVLLRLRDRTATLARHNEALERRLAALQAKTYAVLNSLKRSSLDEQSPPSPSAVSPPPSSLPSSPPSPSSSWSSPPSSPRSASGWSPLSPDSGCDYGYSDRE